MGLARIVVPASAAQNSPGGEAAIRSFKIDIPDAALRDMRERLVRARFPDQLTGAGWTYGTELIAASHSGIPNTPPECRNTIRT